LKVGFLPFLGGLPKTPAVFFWYILRVNEPRCVDIGQQCDCF